MAPATTRLYGEWEWKTSPKKIRAIYENGVFRPTEPVDLPERSAVTVEVNEPNGSGDADQVAQFWKLLSAGESTGDPHLAERHDE